MVDGGGRLWLFEFLSALCKRSRDAGIHTCIETSGYTSSRLFEKTFDFTDLMLFDYKITNPLLHKRYTGVSNELILHNLALAYRAGVPIVLRCPVIPGVNDDDGHFRAICAIEMKFPRLMGIEIMPYHRMGAAKSKGVGCCGAALELPSVDRQTRDLWMTQLRELGCSRIKIG
jgi:pyruvate formate lyase activating enzyme